MSEKEKDLAIYEELCRIANEVVESGILSFPVGTYSASELSKLIAKGQYKILGDTGKYEDASSSAIKEDPYSRASVSIRAYTPSVVEEEYSIDVAGFRASFKSSRVFSLLASQAKICGISTGNQPKFRFSGEGFRDSVAEDKEELICSFVLSRDILSHLQSIIGFSNGRRYKVTSLMIDVENRRCYIMPLELVDRVTCIPLGSGLKVYSEVPSLYRDNLIEVNGLSSSYAGKECVISYGGFGNRLSTNLGYDIGAYFGRRSISAVEGLSSRLNNCCVLDFKNTVNSEFSKLKEIGNYAFRCGKGDMYLECDTPESGSRFGIPLSSPSSSDIEFSINLRYFSWDKFIKSKRLLVGLGEEYLCCLGDLSGEFSVFVKVFK